VARGIPIYHSATSPPKGPAFGVASHDAYCRINVATTGRRGTKATTLYLFVHMRVRTWKPLRRQRRPPASFPSREAVNEADGEADQNNRPDGDAYAHRGGVA
jgi:hypothetical protein